ncbi:MAG: lysophospholipid acyltransferase family protein, partial [Candidatus Cryptobacteroides sp.]
MKKLTNAEKLSVRREHSPNAILYRILMWVIRILNRSVNTSFTYKARPAEEKGPIVLVSNHASRMDYLFTAPVCYPKRLNYVVGYNEFYRFPANILLRIAQVIPKKNFTPDIHCIRSIHRVIQEDGNICLMPEGMSSITGMSQPVMPGTGKVLKSLGCPVYYTIVSGGYLTFTKHFIGKRKGRVEVTVDKMFSSEDLVALSPDQIEDRMNQLLAHDDYIWNEAAAV